MAFHRVAVSVVDYSCKSAGRKGSRKREKSGDWEGENTVGIRLMNSCCKNLEIPDLYGNLNILSPKTFLCPHYKNNLKRMPRATKN